MVKRRPAEERRREIARVAGALFADRGVQATTVRDIGDRVGVLSGSLYHHFKTKHDIVHELMRAYGEDLLARYRAAEEQGGSPRARLERLFRECVRANLEHPDETAILIHELDKLFRQGEFTYLHQLVRDVETIFVKVIVDGMQAGEIRTDLAPAFTYRMMMDVMGAVQRWYDPEKNTEDQVVQGWIDVFFRGIGTA
jgi:AcrR family transcriptional regulator